MTITELPADPKTISGQLEMASRAHDTASATAHRTASATAHRTASAHAKMDEARNAKGEWAKISAADLVMHQDGTVTPKRGGTKVGSLSHEGGRWVAHHGDGTVSKHANRAAALREMAGRHNKAGAAHPAAPAKAPAVKAPAVKPPPKPQPEPPAEEDEDAKYARQEKAERAYFAKLGDVGLDPQRMAGWGVTDKESGAQRDYMSPSGCDVINGALRAGKMPAGHPENSHMDRADVVKNLDAVIARNHTTKPMTVYRGMSVPPGLDLKPGSTFSDKAYVSVSTAENVAKEFASARSTGKTLDGHDVGYDKRGGRAVELVMSMSAGQPVGMGMPHLGELVLPRGSQFHVDSASADGSVLHVSVVPAPQTVGLAADAMHAPLPPWAAGKYKPTAPSEVRRLTWIPKDIAVKRPGRQGSASFARSWDEVCRVVELAGGPRAAGRPLNRSSPGALRPAGRNRTSSTYRVRHVSTPDVNLTSWDDVASVVELSAETGRLAVTPAPYGKPGGPGLYGVKGNKHSDYFESIVQALMRKGMDKGKASAIAWGALRKWQRGGGHVHPEVRAAATGALAEEKVAQARAHGHAASWDDVGRRIDLAAAPPKPDAHQQHVAHLQHLAGHGTPVQQSAAKAALAKMPSPAKSANASAQARVGAGSPAGGQFAPAGGGSPDAHQQHVQHLQHLATHGTPAQKQAAVSLLAKIAAAKAPVKGKTAPKAGTVKAPAKVPAAKTATAKAPAAKATPGTTAKTTVPAAKTAAKATASTTAKAKAKATAHAAHLAHVAHLQHLATAGTQQEQNAARATLTKLGVAVPA